MIQHDHGGAAGALIAPVGQGPPRHVGSARAADSGIEGGAGQQPGRVQHRQGRGVGRHQERDLGAHQAHRITAPRRQPLDDAAYSRRALR
jgi:hypothetical protein